MNGDPRRTTGSLTSLQGQEALRLLEAAVAATQEGITISDAQLPDMPLVYVNAAFERMTGYTANEVMGRNCRFLQANDRNQPGLVIIRNALRHSQPCQVLLRNYRKDGTLFLNELSLHPVRDNEGRLTYFLGFQRDVTTRARLERQTQTQLERRQRHAQLLHQMAQRAATIVSVAELASVVVKGLQIDFGYDHAQLYLLEPNGVLRLLAASAEVSPATHTIPLGEGALGQVAQTGQSLLQPTLSTSDNLLPEAQGQLIAPIKLGEQVQGVVAVQSAKPSQLDDYDQLVLEGLGGQLAVAIENIRLRQAVQERLPERNAQLSAPPRPVFVSQPMHTSGYVFDLENLQPVQKLAALSETEMVQPLNVQGQTIGTLRVVNNPEQPLSADDSSLLESISLQVAQALERVRLFEQTQENLARQERLSTELETVAQVSAAASSSLERDALLQQVVDLTRARFDLYHAQVYLVDEVSETLQLVAGSGDIGRQMVAERHIIPIMLETSIVTRVARTQQPVVINDIGKVTTFLTQRLLPNTRSELAVPLMAGERLLGVFDVQSDQPDRFTEEDIRIQTTLAAQVSVALQNANLFSEQTATVVRLQELDQLKSSFLANMSHELRTPLNSILGFTDVILEGLDGALTDRMENDLKVVQKNGQHLLGLINDILDMAKIEAGRMTLNPETFDLREIIDEVMDITGSLAQARRLSLVHTLAPNTNLTLSADHVRVRQVLINLVGNSIKFTEQGSVTLSAERQGDKMVICVGDTGIGIPPEKLESVFEAFSQVDTSTTRKAGGTGLGLPISRRLIELHGGRLWAESTGLPGEGARFYVELPVEFNRNLLPSGEA